jgi:hypothetical protein
MIEYKPVILNIRSAWVLGLLMYIGTLRSFIFLYRPIKTPIPVESINRKFAKSITICAAMVLLIAWSKLTRV